MTLPLALDEQLALLCQEVHDDAATIEYYERQIEAIRRQIEAKQREAPVLETRIEMVHQAYCQALAFSMLNTLPRELRDKIYYYACVEGEPSLTIERQNPIECLEGLAERKKTTQEIIDRWIFPGFSWDSYDEDSFYRPTESDLDVTREAAEVYFSGNTFIVEYHQVLYPFLTGDFLRLGITPAHYIRKLKAVIRFDPLLLDKKLRTDVHGLQEKTFFRGVHETLQQSAAVLAKMPDLEVTVEIFTYFMGEGDELFSADKNRYPRIDWHVDEQRHLLNITEAIWKPILELRKSQAKVTVEHREEYNGYDEIPELFEMRSLERRQNTAEQDIRHKDMMYIRREKLTDVYTNRPNIWFEKLLQAYWGRRRFIEMNDLDEMEYTEDEELQDAVISDLEDVRSSLADELYPEK